MKLRLHTDIALRALMLMASKPTGPVSTRELAKELKVSRHHLTKIVAELARAGYVKSRRGNQGGVRLARDPEQIFLGDVIAELERKSCLAECFCPDGTLCVFMPDCRLKNRLAEGRRQFIAEMNRSSLGDIANQPEMPKT